MLVKLAMYVFFLRLLFHFVADVGGPGEGTCCKATLVACSVPCGLQYWTAPLVNESGQDTGEGALVSNVSQFSTEFVGTRHTRLHCDNQNYIWTFSFVYKA